jgi:hypothetical protein
MRTMSRPWSARLSACPACRRVWRRSVSVKAAFALGAVLSGCWARRSWDRPPGHRPLRRPGDQGLLEKVRRSGRQLGIGQSLFSVLLNEPPADE